MKNSGLEQNRLRNPYSDPMRIMIRLFVHTSTQPASRVLLRIRSGWVQRHAAVDKEIRGWVLRV